MPYNFELALSTVVTAQVAEEMVKSIVERQTGKKVSTIHCRYDGTRFDGFDIQFEKESALVKSDKSKIFDKKFRPFVWDEDK